MGSGTAGEKLKEASVLAASCKKSVAMEPAVAGAQSPAPRHISVSSAYCLITALGLEASGFSGVRFSTRGVMMTKGLSCRIPGIHQRLLPELHGLLPHFGKSSNTGRNIEHAVYTLYILHVLYSMCL